MSRIERGMTMWFGTRGRMQWIGAPDVTMPSSSINWNARLKFLGGGARVRSSMASAREYTMSWSLVHRSDVQAVIDYADGMYGSGAIYFADPFAMDQNMLPIAWAQPYISGYDGIILDNGRVRPQLIPTSANAYGYPAESAVFNVITPPVGADIYSVYVPIPPGYTAWVGAHGQAGTGGLVQCTVSTGPATVGATTNLTLLPVTTATRFNHSVASTAGDGIILKLGGSGTITLSGLMVQLLPTGDTPATGGFISGQGHSGCSFGAKPSYTPYNAALDRVGVVAELIETESWRFTPNIT